MFKFLVTILLLAAATVIFFRFRPIKQTLSAVYYHDLGNRAVDRNNNDAALKYYQRALPAYPNKPLILTEIGDILVAQGNLAQGEIHYQRALDADPHYLPALLHYGRQEWLAGRHHQALALYRVALESHATDKTFVNDMADSYLTMAKKDHNRKEYRDALLTLNQVSLKSDNFDERKRYELASKLYMQKAYPEALQKYCELATRHPDSPQTLYSMAVTMHRLGDDKDAAMMMNRATEHAELHEPGYAGDWALLSLQFSRNAQMQAAKEQATGQTAKTFPPVTSCLGQYHQAESQAHLSNDSQSKPVDTKAGNNTTSNQTKAQ